MIEERDITHCLSCSNMNYANFRLECINNSHAHYITFTEDEDLSLYLLEMILQPVFSPVLITPSAVNEALYLFSACDLWRSFFQRSSQLGHKALVVC